MYIYLTTAIMALMFVIWSSNGADNIAMRAVFFGMTVWGLFESLKLLGWIVYGPAWTGV